MLVFVVVVLLLVVLALMKDRMRPGMILFSAAVVFLCTGILTPKEMLEGFSNKGMITVALLFLVSEGIRRAGVLEQLLLLLLPKGRLSVHRVQLRLLPIVAAISAFLNNTPVVVIFAPIIKRWAESVRLPSTKFLIPLSYATILGGMCTLIGTSTNLVVDGMVMDAGYPGFTMFELGKVGIFIAIAGIVYMLLFSHWLLPDSRTVDQTGELSGKDSRYFRVDVVLGARFPAIGKNIFDFDFKRKYGATILELRRNGESFLMHDMRKVRYHEGDTLVLLADEEFLTNWGDSSFFLMVSSSRGLMHTLSRAKRWVAVVLVIMMVLGSTVGELPTVRSAFPKVHLDMFFFASVVTIVMAWLQIFPARKYTKFISWDILITIASAFAISKAMMNSGVAESIAAIAIRLTDNFGPYVLLAFIFIVTDCFTELMTNNAAAALTFPISLSIAQQLGVSPMPFFVTICMAASSSFSTPIGYQTNLIVQGVGGYRFADFVRAGLPLNIISFLISIFLIPIFWPF